MMIKTNPTLIDSLIEAIALLMAQAEALEFRATHDPLTGLFNRAMFYVLLDNNCKQREPRFSVIYLDLNNFKAVNDTYGHQAGDTLLKQVGNAISANLREGDAVARMGGDEFLILLPDTGLVEAAVICDRVSSAVAAIHAEVSSSSGIAEYRVGDDPDLVIARADQAMYSAKAEQTACAIFAGVSCDISKIQDIQELDKAIDNKELVPFLQPIAVSYNHRILGYEALVRWPTPTGLKSPGQFLPIAEQAGWLPRIDWLMLSEVCRQLEYFPDQWVSVNLSASTILEAGFVAKLKALLEGYFLNPQQLSLEISESAAISGSVEGDQIIDRLQEISHEVGQIHILVDDYGSAYAQPIALLKLIKQVPNVKALKIVGDLVSGLDSDPDKMTACQNAISMAHGLRLEAIAEGVETEGEAHRLVSMNCDYLQGYWLGRPLPIKEYIPSCVSGHSS
jgi:diguanylate cyclase (GGDEF)-like protein